MTMFLVACSPGPSEQPVEPSVPEPAEGEEHIACAVDGATEMSDACAVERVRDGNTLTLVIRHPDGGFRRFVVTNDGTGLAAADGADEAIVALGDDGFADVTIGQDRYRFPATRMDDVGEP